MVVAVRALLVAIAAGAVLTSFLATPHDESDPVVASMYTCPMHPEIRPHAADSACPICRMALEPMPSRTGAAGDRFVLAASAALPSSHAVVRARVRVESRAIRALAWVESRERGAALVYRDDASLLAPADEGVFVPLADSSSAGGVRVRLTGDLPTRWDSATSLVRFAIPGKRASPNRTGWLELAPRARREVVVPYSAVLHSPAGPYVLVVAADNRTLTRRAIEIGRVRSGHASVISGLADGERVAAMNTFSLDAERRLGRGSAP